VRRLLGEQRKYWVAHIRLALWPIHV
jgi:hypothetical protein